MRAPFRSEEVDDKSPQPWLAGYFRRPKSPAIPGLKPQFETISSVARMFLEPCSTPREIDRERLERRIIQAGNGTRPLEASMLLIFPSASISHTSLPSALLAALPAL